MDHQHALRIDLHVHSSFSDGTLAPEQLASELSAAGCSHVALTDHNTTAGWERFREATERHGMRAVCATELDAHANCRHIHLLAYGFDEHNRELLNLLRALRHPWGPFLLTANRNAQIKRVAPGTGAAEAGSAIRCFHQAGGKVFLAHPLTVTQDWTQLEQALLELKALGLDGIEAHYKSYDRDTRQHLCELAEKLSLLTCAGSDYHGPEVPLGASTPGYDIPESAWRPLAHAIGINEGLSRTPSASGLPPRQLRKFLLHIGLPAALAGLLFVLTIFTVLLPAIEKQLLERKKETIRELTRTAASILHEYHNEARAGLMTEEQAMRESAERISRMRYGEEGKDYFWITDMHPTMVMHPYRVDLNGKDLSDFQDKAGNRVFVAFVDAVREDDAGYVNYYWQWKDDPGQIVPKLSYLQAFRPWNWVIGTGIYTEDVQAEIASIKDRLILACLLISATVAVLLFYVAQQSYRIERRRARTEEELAQSNQKYRTLVEASTECTMMILGGECAYANAPLEEMLGYTPGTLSGRPVLGLLQKTSTLDKSALEHMNALLSGEPAPLSFPARITGNQGQVLEVLLSATPVSFDAKEGVILLVRDMRRPLQVADAVARSRDHYRKLTQGMPLGVFRSRWDSDSALLLEANPAALQQLGLPPESAPQRVDWLARIVEPEQRQRVRDALVQKESVEIEGLSLRRDDGKRIDVRLFAVLVHEEDQLFCDGILEDITRRTRHEVERDTLISQLQTSLFFLQEPVSRIMRGSVSLSLADTVSRAVALMTKEESSAIVVCDNDHHPVGIFTDSDLRSRVLHRSADQQTPLRQLMSAPLIRIQADALISEATHLMQENACSHLAVVDSSDLVIGMIHIKDILHYSQYSTVLLASRITQASSAEDLQALTATLPELVRALLLAGSRVRSICRTISGTSDRVATRLVELAQQELGSAPGPFALVAMGSQARFEQTLSTDQDTGLIYASPPADQADRWAEYFLALGKYVTQGLDQAGYPLCPGGVMASEPEWNQSILGWISTFERCVQQADAEELLNINIAFDLRCITGDTLLVQQLKTAMHDAVAEHPPFLLQLARNALLAKPPLGVRGNIVTHKDDGEKRVSLKEALLPIVNYGRLYSLQHRIDETHTLDRLGELQHLGGLSASGYSELLTDYEVVMQMRLSRQVDSILAGRAMTNSIGPAEWTDYEEAMLKRLYSLSGDLRKKISFDFLGGMS